MSVRGKFKLTAIEQSRGVLSMSAYAQYRKKPLTRRQDQVLRLLCAGLENKHVAARLGVGESTVETHRRALMLRTQTGNAVQLGIWAERHGYTESKPPSEPCPLIRAARPGAAASPPSAAAGGAG